MAVTQHRSGRHVKQIGGYSAFVPRALPPEPPLKLPQPTLKLLNDAGLALGRLDGLTVNLPNPNMFVAMYVRKEALLSSQIEGTQASLDDVLAFEAEQNKRREAYDAAEVVNYTKAMNYGIQQLDELPLCLRMIRDVHRILLAGVRGEDKTPGDFRETQNWIGTPGCAIGEASFVPPPPDEMKSSLGELEEFINKNRDFPSLVRCALVHAQFETIHPFVDGNGRVGRLLITLMLCEEEVLHQPLLYLSYYFKANRQRYYDILNEVRFEGKWEEWIEFFLQGVIEVSQQATETAGKILGMRREHENIVQKARPRGASNALALLDALYDTPYLTAGLVCKRINVSPPTANALLSLFAELGLVREVTGQKWGQLYGYEPYLQLLRRGTEPVPEDVEKGREELATSR